MTDMALARARPDDAYPDPERPPRRRGPGPRTVVESAPPVEAAAPVDDLVVDPTGPIEAPRPAGTRP
nr:hypothetical protein [Actinomycetota bacterium]